MIVTPSRRGFRNQSQPNEPKPAPTGVINGVRWLISSFHEKLHSGKPRPRNGEPIERDATRDGNGDADSLQTGEES